MDFSADGDFHHIVVAVPVGVAAQAEDIRIFLIGVFGIEQPVAGTEFQFSCDIDHLL